MRENIARKKLPESGVARALDALEGKKDGAVAPARETKSKADLMRIAKEKAEKIRARALELQEKERTLAQKRTQEYVAHIQSQGTEEVVTRKPQTKRKVSFEEMEKIADEEKPRQSVVQKEAITPRNAEILARAKEIAQRVAAKKVEERSGVTQKETIEELSVQAKENPAEELVVKGNPKNQNENHVLSYEDTGIPLKSLKKKKEWEGDPQKTRLVSGVEYAAIPEDLEIDTEDKPEEVHVEEISKTQETPLEKTQETKIEDPTVKQLHEEALHELGFLKDFCKMYHIDLVVDEDTLDIVNYEKLLRKDLQRLEQTENKEVAEEFLMLLGIASGAGAAYEFEKNKQAEEEKLKAFREKRAREEAELPVAEEIEEEEELPEAEEVVEEAEVDEEHVEESEMPTQKVEQETGEQDKEILERDLKASWLVLLRKRRIAKQIEAGGIHLEFDTELPEKFNFSADGLLPQNAREVWNAVKEKGTEAQKAYIREFFVETFHYIDMLEKWESLEGTENKEVPESEQKTQEVPQEKKEKDTKLTRFNKVVEVRNEIKRRFPWVKFKNEKISTSTLPGNMGFEDPSAVTSSRVFTEGKDNPRTGEKSLRTLREDLRTALKAFEEKFDDNPNQGAYEKTTYTMKGKEAKKKDYLPKTEVAKGDLTSEELAEKAIKLFNTLKSKYPVVEFAQPKGEATNPQRGDLDILNLEAIRRLPEYREEDPDSGETLAEIIGEFNQTLEALDSGSKLNKFVKVKEGDRTRVVREKDVRAEGYAKEAEARAAQQRDVAEGRMLEQVERDEINKERQFTDLLQKNPMPKELREFVESGKLNLKKDYFATGDAKEAVKRAMKELTTRISERNKKNGVFGLVSRLTFADKEHRNLKEVQKQLEHWGKYLR